MATSDESMPMPKFELYGDRQQTILAHGRRWAVSLITFDDYHLVIVRREQQSFVFANGEGLGFEESLHFCNRIGMQFANMMRSIIADETGPTTKTE